MLDFPSSPSVGQHYPASAVIGVPQYEWDGQKWKNYLPPQGVPASTTPLAADSVAAPGVTHTWSRGDHKHPSDLSRVPTANPSFSGTLTANSFNPNNITLGGIMTVAQKGSQLGNAGPETWDNTSPANCNIVFYDFADGNWAGVGSDVNGFWYVRTGGAGSNAVAAMIADTANVGFTGNVYAPTPTAGDNTNKVATTAYVVANQPVGGPYLPLTGGTLTGSLTVANADMYTYRNGAPLEAVIFFNSAGNRYVHWTGGNYHFVSTHVYTLAGRSYGNGDFSTPVTSARIGPHAGDPGIAAGAGLSEPYGGAVITGRAGTVAGGARTHRYRYSQIYIAGTWYTAGYA